MLQIHDLERHPGHRVAHGLWEENRDMLLKDIHAIENAARIAMAAEEDAQPAGHSGLRRTYIGLAAVLLACAAYMLLA